MNLTLKYYYIFAFFIFCLSCCGQRTDDEQPPSEQTQPEALVIDGDREKTPVKIEEPSEKASVNPSDLVKTTKRPEPPRGPEFLGQQDQEILDAILNRRMVGARGTPGVSLSMRVDLRGPIDAAFKPRARGGQRWAGEVAAYRFGRLLRINRIPPAITRKVRISKVQSLLRDNPEVLERFNKEAIFEQGNKVRGAFIYWVPIIHATKVDQLEELHHWTVWLKQGGVIPPEKVEFAHQLSDTIVFDFLVGNWDRWSGENVYLDSEKQVLLIMDNNAAFQVKFSAHLRKRLVAPLDQVERFSASLYRRVVGLSVEDVRAELDQDPSGDMLLSDKQMKAVFDRREELLERIEKLKGQYGHDEVLCFP